MTSRTFLPTKAGCIFPVSWICADVKWLACPWETVSKQLVMDALQDAINHTNNIEGCILHSNRGKSVLLQGLPANGVPKPSCHSMNLKGNCWNNAPMESFWGTLKQEWLNDRHFHIRDEAKTAIFEYIWIFYNRKRKHSSIGYTTPEKYYAARLVQKLVA
jgi:putative transposase